MQMNLVLIFSTDDYSIAFDIFSISIDYSNLHLISSQIQSSILNSNVVTLSNKLYAFPFKTKQGVVSVFSVQKNWCFVLVFDLENHIILCYSLRPFSFPINLPKKALILNTYGSFQFKF